MKRTIRRQRMMPGLVIVTLAAALVTFVGAAPAYAATCTVNGVPQTGASIDGTPGDDIITCGAISSENSIRGLDGNDIITTGNVTGLVTGGDGNDTITTGSISPGILFGGRLSGDTGDDILRAPAVLSGLAGRFIVHSHISAGPGNDIIEGVTPGTPVIADSFSSVSGGTGIDFCNVSNPGGPIPDCE